MDWIYLDNNATTQPLPEVRVAMEEIYDQYWSNPSSVHRFGQAVRQRVELARQQVAQLIGAKPAEMIFTSGGTESNNLALHGYLVDPESSLLITNKVEHSAIREPAEALAKSGYEVAYLDVDEAGLVSVEHLQRILDEQVEGDTDKRVLVSVQWANNETGLVQPIAAIGEAVQACRERMKEAGKRAQVLFHVDGTQVVGKMAVDVKANQLDMMTFASHKFHGPKGVGGLYCRLGTRLNPQLRGGSQERDRRGGTENTAGIVGMGVACAAAKAFVEDEVRINELRAMREAFEARVLEVLPDTVINSKTAAGVDCHRLWNTSNLGFPGLESEALLLGLSERGICASAGAACSSGSLEPSPVLLAMGIPEKVAHGSVRFSMCRFTTQAELDQAVAAIPEVVGRLRKMMPLG